jgi:hypothetical protein
VLEVQAAIGSMSGRRGKAHQEGAMRAVGYRAASLVFDTARGANRRKVAFIVGAVLLASLLLAATILLRSHSEDGFRWVPPSNPGTPIVVDAYVGKPVLVMDRVRILVKSVDRAHDSFSAEVRVTNEPEMDINGGVHSRFRDKDSTIEIQAADLGQDSVKFNVWSIRQ